MTMRVSHDRRAISLLTGLSLSVSIALAGALPQKQSPAFDATETIVAGQVVRGLRARFPARIAVGSQRPVLTMTYPRTYDGPVVIDLDSQHVALRPVAPRRSPAETNASRISYAEVYEHVDTIQMPGIDQAQQQLILRADDATLVYEFEIVETSGIAQTMVGDDGTIRFIPSGASWPLPGPLQIYGTSVVDATGVRTSSARWTIAGAASGRTRIRLTIDGDHLSYPAVVSFSFGATGSMAGARSAHHTATLLQNGKILIAGGFDSGAISSAELFDPSNGKFTPTGSMTTTRYGHTATLLGNGKVLITGGAGPSTYLASSELYDPTTGLFTATGDLGGGRYFHTATTLNSGKVLIAGGAASAGALSACELYDPVTGTFTPAASLGTARQGHTATLLRNGQVLIAGGATASVRLSSVEIYDPTSNAFSPTGNLAIPRDSHSASLLPNGKVIVAGGADASGPLASAELYDAALGTFAPAGNMTAPRQFHSATVMPNGKLLITGGSSTSTVLSSAEWYDPVAATFSSASEMTTARQFHTTTLLPNGRLLIAGGAPAAPSSAELYTDEAGTVAPIASMFYPHSYHTATLLPDGNVLVIGASPPPPFPPFQPYPFELFNAAANTFSDSGDLFIAGHTATLLRNGLVLIAGGYRVSRNGVSIVTEGFSAAYLYDPLSGQARPTGSMATPHWTHTATLLSSGKVLIVGGSSLGSGFGGTSAELYDPVAGSFNTAATFANPRNFHTATLLRNGKVLIAGGYNGIYQQDAEVYDPAAGPNGTFSPTGDLSGPRGRHTATLLPSGEVLVAGGTDSTGASLASAELYDPTTGTFSATGSMHSGRQLHAATSLSNGIVLITGGLTGDAISTDFLPTTETYDRASASFTSTTPMGNARGSHTATLLRDGKVFIAGGIDGSGELSSTELFDPGSGLSESSRPVIASIPAFIRPPAPIALTGTAFRGDDSSSGIYNGSPTNYPLLRLQRMDNAETFYLSPTAWSGTSFTTPTATSLIKGHYRASIVANAIPSIDSIILITDALPPSIATISPSSGPLTGGQTVTVTGLNLTGATVLIGNLAVDLTTASATSMTFTSPMHEAGAVDVIVRTSGGSATKTGGYTYVAEPIISDVVPSAGSTAGGQSVTITGQNFGGLMNVKFDGINGTVTASNATSITVTTPPHPAEGRIVVMVTSTYGSSTSTAASTFTYLSKPSFAATGGMTSARQMQTATLLPNGTVLIAGGSNGTTSVPSAELYNPATGAFNATGSMTAARIYHTATLLLNGKVLIAGGNGTTSAELYDPATGTFGAAGPMTAPRSGHTATLLSSGKVLLVGGGAATAELYNPVANTFVLTAAPPAVTRSYHTATLLRNGKVLIAGGLADTGPLLQSAELYDPLQATFAASTPLTTGRYSHSATVLASGKVLFTGGFDLTGFATASAELFDPNIPNMTTIASMSNARGQHSATLLPNGNVLIAGGSNGSSLTSCELFVPSLVVFKATVPLTTGRQNHSATLLPNGKTLIAGGPFLSSADLYDVAIGTFSQSATSIVYRSKHTSTVLTDGRVLIAGGIGDQGALQSAEIYDPNTGTSTAIASLTVSRYGHSATLLSNGTVLIAGGFTSTVNGDVTLQSAEIFDPDRSAFSAIATMVNPHAGHTATLLPSGRVLLVGSSFPEVYDPATRAFSYAGPMVVTRAGAHTATLLATGKVLIAGGLNTVDDILFSAELYDPSAATPFTATGNLGHIRRDHAAVLLPNGKVLIAGGNGVNAGKSEIYDPTTGTFSTGANLVTPRILPTLTMLGDGRVLVTGTVDAAEIYDPGSGTFSFTGSLRVQRTFHSATLISDGRVLLIGGSAAGADLYDSGFGDLDSRRPVIVSAPASVNQTGTLTVGGSGFRGDSESSSGSFNSSATNMPLLRLQRVDNDQMFFVRSGTAWSDSSFTTIPMTGFPNGYYRTAIVTNAIASREHLVLVTDASAPAITTIVPNAGPNSGGQAVTITGTNLSNAAVSFGGMAATVTASNATSVSLITPAQTDGPVEVRLTTFGGMALGTYTYGSAPTITAISPNAGPASGLQAVTIDGTNFSTLTSVKFASSNGSVTSHSATSISVTTPPGAPGAAQVTVTTTFGTASTAGYRYIVAAPAAMSAAANGVTSVTVTWPAVSGAASYEISRSANNVTFAPAGSAVGTSFTDTGIGPNTAYLYRVRALDFSMQPGPYTAADLATTVSFADDPIIAGTTMLRAAQINQLRTAVNAVRVLAGLTPVSFTDGTLVLGAVVKAEYVRELRLRLAEARAELPLPSIVYLDPIITSKTTPIKAIHMIEIRAGVK